jgi:hypothetical protein
LSIVGATGATVNGRRDSASVGPVLLAAPKDAIPTIAPVAAAGTPGPGYIDLASFGITPQPIGDEENVNFPVPDYVYGGNTYGRIGVDSNGYLSVGGTDSAADISFLPQTFPDATSPNGVLASYWTDLDGSGAPGITAANLSDGVNSWLVVQWNVHVFGVSTAAGGARNMQVWIGLNGAEDITYSYATDTIGVDAPPTTGLTVGAENVSGVAGAQISGPPAGSYVVTTKPGIPGGSLTYSLDLKATRTGPQTLTSTMHTSVVAGLTRVVTPIPVTRR